MSTVLLVNRSIVIHTRCWALVARRRVVCQISHDNGSDAATAAPIIVEWDKISTRANAANPASAHSATRFGPRPWATSVAVIVRSTNPAVQRVSYTL